MIIIRQANYEDISRIMKFIDDHWKKGHIMGNDRAMFEFQHVEGQEVHYVIAEDNSTKRIYGTMGYIPMNHSDTPDVFTVMILTLRDSGHDFLGDEMSDWLEKELKIRYHVAVGINKRYAKAISVLEPGCIDTWNQYYRLADRNKYKICKVFEKKISKVQKDTGCFLKNIDCKDELASILGGIRLEELKPYRDERYILHRYWEHPVYEYQYFAIMNEEECKGLLIGRELDVCGTQCFRIVDFYGEANELRYIGNELDNIMKKKNYEYIDFCNFGIAPSLMREAGFEIVGQDSNIIPHYFEPFEQRNIEIYVYSNSLKDITLFKAFSDQDRPNKI